MKLTNQQIEAVAELISCKEEKQIAKEQKIKNDSLKKKHAAEAKNLFKIYKSIPEKLKPIMYSHRNVSEALILNTIIIEKPEDSEADHCCQSSYKKRVVLASIDAKDFTELKKNLGI